jgi:putative Holliday junction resolvase
MARILAIDYGSKRVGIAVTDPLKMIATGLTTVHSKDVIQFIKDYMAKEQVDAFVLGEPKRLNNTDTDATRLVNAILNLLKKTFPDMPIHRIDERFTSKMASQAIIMSGVKKKGRRDKALVDVVSATIILQSYLETQTFF